MTGRELRNVLAEQGLTPSQFTARFAKAKAKTGTATEESGKRAAKRWLSKRKQDEQLSLRGVNREIVARILGVEPRALVPPDGPGRLEELAAQLADVEDRLERLEKHREELPAQGEDGEATAPLVALMELLARQHEGGEVSADDLEAAELMQRQFANTNLRAAEALAALRLALGEQ